MSFMDQVVDTDGEGQIRSSRASRTTPTVIDSYKICQARYIESISARV